MKVWLCLLLSMAVCFSMVGCGQNTPLKDKLIVEGIGVDLEGELYSVTVQVYSPSSGEDSGGESQLFEEKGESIGKALAQIDKNLGKTSFYADTKVILLSQKALEKGLWNLLDVFIRSSEMGSNVCVAATNEPPAQLFSIEKEGNTMPSKMLANGLRYGRNDSSPVSGELLRIVQGLMDESVSVSIPMVKTVEKEGKKYPEFEGILCFQGDKPCYVMDESMKWVYHWMNNYADQRSFLIEQTDGVTGILLHESRVSINSEIQNGTPTFFIQLSLEGEVAETNILDGLSEEGMKELKTTAQKIMERLTVETLQQMVNIQKCDVFRLGKTLRKQQSDYFKEMSSRERVMEQATYTVQVDLDINRVGQQAVS